MISNIYPVKKLNFKIIFQMMGFLLIFNGLFMLLASAVSFYFKDGATQGIVTAGLVTIFTGILFRFATKGFKKEVKRREGYIIVTMGWILMSLSGSLPYLFTETIPLFTNAFFETMSGFTTTAVIPIVLRWIMLGWWHALHPSPRCALPGCPARLRCRGSTASRE